MVEKEKLNNAISAIQYLIIWARNLVYQGYSKEELAAFLDAVEYLPALILEKDDRTELVEEFLEDVCVQHDFPEVLIKYNSSMQ